MPKKRRIEKSPTMLTHGFRKYFATACNRPGVNMNQTLKEKLMGHKAGLDVKHYDRSDDSVLLQEYVKVIDEVTIDDAYRLNSENIELKKEVEDINLLKQKVNELTKEKNSIKIELGEYVKKTNEELDVLWEEKMYGGVTNQIYDIKLMEKQGLPRQPTPTTQPTKPMTPKEKRKLERRKINFSYGNRRWKKGK